LRSKHSQKKTWFGVNARTQKITDMMEEVVEPLAVKEEIISAATEASCMVLRVDDVLAKGKSAAPPMPPGGGMPGGGMM